MRTLGIDVGSKRIGLALSDAGGTWASAYDAVAGDTADGGIEAIAGIVLKEGVERIVVGLPLNMDGTEGAGAKGVREFAKKILARCGKPVILVDERLSSFEASQQITDRKRAGEKITRKGKKKRLDAMSAAAFLAAFLEGKARGEVAFPTPSGRGDHVN